jgi:hypothetical protein
MKKSGLLSIVVLLSLLSNSMFAQSTCKVLNPRIADSYTGSCKQGLADGKGEALGVDQYNGEFKKGLPEGAGIYIWETGEKYEGSWKKGMRDGEGSYTFKSDGKDTVLTGIWKEDKYAGEHEAAAYIIQYRNSIPRVSCVRMGDVPYVVYKFSRAGGSMQDITNLLMQGSSGNETVSWNFTGFEQVTFPFEGKIKFNAPNAMHTATLSCELRYVINQPGSWTVTIYY